MGHSVLSLYVSKCVSFQPKAFQPSYKVSRSKKKKKQQRNLKEVEKKIQICTAIKQFLLIFQPRQQQLYTLRLQLYLKIKMQNQEYWNIFLRNPIILLYCDVGILHPHRVAKMCLDRCITNYNLVQLDIGCFSI